MNAVPYSNYHLLLDYSTFWTEAVVVFIFLRLLGFVIGLEVMATDAFYI